MPLNRIGDRGGHNERGGFLLKKEAYKRSNQLFALNYTHYRDDSLWACIFFTRAAFDYACRWFMTRADTDMTYCYVKKLSQ